MTEFREEQRKELIALIKREFAPYSIELKFLDHDVGKEEIRATNTFFILALNITAAEFERQEGQFNIWTSSYPAEDGSCAWYKTLALPIMNANDPLYTRITIPLHECLHAIGEMKHFRPAGSSDVGPFITAAPGSENAIDCSESLMAYEIDCKQIQDGVKKEGFTTEEFFAVPFYTSHSLFKDKVKRILNNSPVHIGPLDKEVLKITKKEFEERNKAVVAKTNQVNQEEIKQEETIKKEELFIRHPGLFDKFLWFICKQAKKMTDDCPSYFLTASTGEIQYYHNMSNPSLFFNQSCPAVPQINATTSLQIGY